MYNYDVFYNWLASTMAARGITQEDLAAGMQVSQQAVSRWCRGETMPRGPRVSQLAKQLGVPVEEVAKEMEDEQSSQQDAGDELRRLRKEVARLERELATRPVVPPARRRAPRPERP